MSTLQRGGRARLRSERRHCLADPVRQYELLSQLDIRSSLGYSVLRARKLEGKPVTGHVLRGGEIITRARGAGRGALAMFFFFYIYICRQRERKKKKERVTSVEKRRK